MLANVGNAEQQQVCQLIIKLYCEGKSWYGRSTIEGIVKHFGNTGKTALLLHGKLDFCSKYVQNRDDLHLNLSHRSRMEERFSLMLQKLQVILKNGLRFYKIGRT